MTIRIDFIGSLSCPFFACDVCGQHIRHAGVAMAAWSEGIDDDPASVTPAHVHKRECLAIFEARLPASHVLMTDELSDHIAHLLQNSGYEVPGGGMRFDGFGDFSRLRRRCRENSA